MILLLFYTISDHKKFAAREFVFAFIFRSLIAAII